MLAPPSGLAARRGSAEEENEGGSVFFFSDGEERGWGVEILHAGAEE